MLIESLIKPVRNLNTRTISHFGKTLVFKEVAPGRFVAAVQGEKEIAALLAASGGYIEFTDKLAGPPKPAEAPVQVAPADAPPPADENETEPAQAGKSDEPPSFTPEDQAAAEALLSGNPQQVFKGLRSASPAVVAAARVIEAATAKPRPSVIAALDG
jgi:hypothetical protein